MLAAVFRRCSVRVALVGLLALPRAGGALEAVPAPDASTASPLGLTWVSSDPSCDGSAVAARAVELVKAGVTPRPTQARAQVSRDGAQWVVDLQTRSESQIGRRTLRGESCKEIQQAIALLLAMIMESEARAEVAQPAPAQAASSPPPVAPVLTLNTADPEADEAPPAPPPPHPVEDGFGFTVRMEGSAALGVQPALGLGVLGSIGAAYGPFEVHVGAGYWPTSRVPVLDRNGFFEMNRKTLTAAACFRIWDGASFQALSCVGPEWIWEQHEAVGLSLNLDNARHGAPALSASLELRVQLVGPMFFSIAPGVSWARSYPFSARPCINCDAIQVFHTWPLGPRLGAGIGARF